MELLEEFIEDNIKAIVITIIVLIVVFSLYFILREKKTYEIIECKSNGGYFERSIEYKNNNDTCNLTINAGSKPTSVYELKIKRVKISRNNNVVIEVENKKISDETLETFTNPYCKIEFNFPCNDVYVKDNHNRIYNKIDNVN